MVQLSIVAKTFLNQPAAKSSVNNVIAYTGGEYFLLRRSSFRMIDYMYMDFLLEVVILHLLNSNLLDLEISMLQPRSSACTCVVLLQKN